MQSQLTPGYSRLAQLLVACGLVITINGYDSRVVDQCYRLPVLERMTDARAYPADQFVDAFEKFNPHLGYLRLLQFGSGIFGLSITLFLLYSLTVLLTTYSIWRIRELLFPEMPHWSNWLLLLTFFLCKAGNLGTNHIWEDHLLDRQIAFSLGWFALALWLECHPSIGIKIPVITGLIAVIHPGLGLLNLALWLTVFSWNFLTGIFKRNDLILFVIAIFLSMIPWALLYLGQSSVLKAGVSPELFWSLATELQGPQHMRSSLWRSSQWYAAISLTVFASIQFLVLMPKNLSHRAFKQARQWLLLILIGLFISWPAIEYFHNLNITLAQPWRMATPVRGFLLIILNSIIFEYIKSNRPIIKGRAFSIIFGLRNDIVTFSLFLLESVNLMIKRTLRDTKPSWQTNISGIFLMTSTFYAILWVYDHDPQHGHYVIIAGYVAGPAVDFILRKLQISIDDQSGKLYIPTKLQIAPRNAIILAWILPAIAIIYCGFDASGKTIFAQILASKWRIYETPRSDAEKLGAWLHANIAPNAMILSPPRDKSLRLWSHRSVVANVAGSPYQAEELKKWSERIATLSGFSGDIADFAHQWPENRVRFETFYEKATSNEIIAWANQNQANVIVVPSAERFESLATSGWEKAHVEGRLAAWLKNHDFTKIQP